MKKTQFGESKAHRFFSGKGFYIALAVSLIAVGAAAWIGVNSAMSQMKQPEPKVETPQQVEQDEWELPPDFTVDVPQKDVPAENKAEAPAEPEPKPEQPTAVEQGYIMPLKGEILNPYSGDKVVKSKTLDDWVMHTGVDLAADVSTPVKAISAGTVEEIVNDDLWGTTVTIRHANGITSYYANLKSAVKVTKGQEVKLGDVIGSVGETADIERAEASHLHFGMKQDNEWIDPLSMIQ